MASSFLYQPSPRFCHSAAQVKHKTYLWGGMTADFLTTRKKTLPFEIEAFDTFSETWTKKMLTGVPPPGLCNGGFAVVAETLYYYGGHDGRSPYSSIQSLNTETLEWRELQSKNPADQPMPKFNHGIVTYHDETVGVTSITVLAGFGIPHGPTQAGAKFVENTNFTDGRGWTNELHLFNLTNGEWSSPPTTGPRPPPCSRFSFTAINHHMAVMFGGYHCVQGGRQLVNNVYIIDFRSMEWTKLERPEGVPWPVERDLHAACCLNFGDVHPQLLITGGVDKKGKTLSDAWLLDINTRRWRELTLPEGTQPRWGHTVISFRLDEDRVHATTFGGCPDWASNRSDDDDPKLADTIVMEFESVQSSSAGGAPTSEWVLMGVVSSSGLGTPERLTRLEEIRQRKAYKAGWGFPPRPITIRSDFPFQPVAAEPFLTGPLVSHNFPYELPTGALRFLHQSTTPPSQQQDKFHAASIQVPPTASALQPPHRSGGFYDMGPEQLHPMQPIEPSLLDPYYVQSLLPHSAFLPLRQSDMHSFVSSTATHQVEASTATAPSFQPSSPCGPITTSWTTVSATSLHTYYSDAPLHEPPLPRGESQTADVPKLEQLSPKEKKPSLLDIKPKIEWSPKKEPEDVKIEPKEEVEIDVKLKQEFSDVEKGDSLEQLALKNKLLLDMISQLKQQIAEKDWKIAEQTKQIAEKGEKYQQMNEGVLQESRVRGKLPPPMDTQSERLEGEFHASTSELAALTHGGMRTGVTTTEYLRGFETFAETSFVVNDSWSHSFEWQRYGLKLHIPEGAVPAENTECRVDIKAGFTGQFNIPDELQLISCVYWLSCPQKFVKPVTLEIEHCASLQDSSQSSSLQFIVAKCSQAELPYQFRVLKKGIFVPRSSYGSIELSQFSLFGVSILKRAWRLWPHSYYSTLYYIRNNINNWDVDFVITLHLQAALTAIQDKYFSLDAIPGPGFEVQFESDTISLAIPEDGVSLQNGWEIIPLIAPVIEKQQVDGFKPWKEIPYCRLQVTLDRDRKPVKLKHKVKLLGAKGPRDFFTIICMAEEFFVKPAIRDLGGKRKQLEEIEQDRPMKKRLVSDVTSAVQKESKVLGTDTLANITHYLHSLDKTAIFNLGLVLGLDYNRLKTMTDSANYLVDMLAGWLQRVDRVVETGVPTWTRIVKALKDPRVGRTGVADKIEQDNEDKTAF